MTGAQTSVRAFSQKSTIFAASNLLRSRAGNTTGRPQEKNLKPHEQTIPSLRCNSHAPHTVLRAGGALRVKAPEPTTGVTAYIDALRSALERCAGHALVSPAHFQQLALRAQAEGCGHVSASTLRRFFGYVHNAHQFTNSTLSTLSRLAGYTDWAAFCRMCDLTRTTDSDFLSQTMIHAYELFKGDRVEVAWLPNRRMELLYLGNNNFTVTQAVNAKLVAGDNFQALIFAVGLPLYVSHLVHGGRSGLTYVAGQEHGLTSVTRKERTE